MSKSEITKEPSVAKVSDVIALNASKVPPVSAVYNAAKFTVDPLGTVNVGVFELSKLPAAAAFQVIDCLA